jgi:hypothetical protein
VNNVSGTGSPILPQPLLLTNSTNITAGSGNHVLNVFITEQDLSSPTGIAQFLSRFSSTLFTGAVTSVVETTLLSTSNALYAGTQLSTATFTTGGFVVGTQNSPSLAPLYSETAQYTITTSGAGNVVDAIVISTPEPASLTLFGVGLLSTLAFARRRLGSGGRVKPAAVRYQPAAAPLQARACSPDRAAPARPGGRPELWQLPLCSVSGVKRGILKSGGRLPRRP